MAKKTKRSAVRRLKLWARKNARTVVLPLFVVIGAGALILAAITIIIMPTVNSGSQSGVGADGFRAYRESGTGLGVDKVVTKDNVVKILDGKAKSVSDADLSTVFNLDGTRSQTVTYDFVRTDGVKASLYVDLMFFKNQSVLNDAKITVATLDIGKINGHQAYYMHAQTLGSDREYRLMVVNGLKVYRFVIDQPVNNITISEVSALSVLKRLAATAALN